MLISLHSATSAVDLETDKGIQEIIRGPAFADVTMLVIAYVNKSLIYFTVLKIADNGYSGIVLTQ